LVSDQAKSKESVQFAVNSDNTALQFVAKKEPKKIQIYSAEVRKQPKENYPEDRLTSVRFKPEFITS
jgi:hypothetical protein